MENWPQKASSPEAPSHAQEQEQERLIELLGRFDAHYQELRDGISHIQELVSSEETPVMYKDYAAGLASRVESLEQIRQQIEATTFEKMSDSDYIFFESYFASPDGGRQNPLYMLDSWEGVPMHVVEMIEKGYAYGVRLLRQTFCEKTGLEFINPHINSGETFVPALHQDVRGSEVPTSDPTKVNRIYQVARPGLKKRDGKVVHKAFVKRYIGQRGGVEDVSNDSQTTVETGSIELT